MNYILEIKAFYDWLEVNQLPTSAIVLWHALMHIANKTGWKDNFTVAVVVLEIKTGLKRQALFNARTVLQNKGLITFSSRGGCQSAVYSMKPISIGVYDIVSVKDTQTHTQSDTQSHTQTHTQSDTQSHTINKLNKTKLNKTKHKNTPLPPHEVEGKNSNAQKNEIWDKYKAVYSQELQTVVLQWLKYKQEKRQDYKAQGLNSLLSQIQKKVGAFGDNAVIEIINNSMASNYQGLVWDRLEKQGGYANGNPRGDSCNHSSSQKPSGYAENNTRTASTGEYAEETEGARLNKMLDQYRGTIEDTDCDY